MLQTKAWELRFGLEELFSLLGAVKLTEDRSSVYYRWFNMEVPKWYLAESLMLFHFV